MDEGLLRYQQAQEEAKKSNFRLVNDMVEERVDKLPDGHLFDVKHEGALDGAHRQPSPVRQTDQR